MSHTGTLRRVAAAALSVALAGGLILSIAPKPAAAYNLMSVSPWLDRAEAGYNHHIPVCLHSNYYGGPPWDLSWNTTIGTWNNTAHRAANTAIKRWNAVGGQLYFFRSNSNCDYLASQGDSYVQIGTSLYFTNNGWSGQLGHTTLYPTFCLSSPNLTCIDRAAVWLNRQQFGFDYSAPETDYPTVINNTASGKTVLTHEVGHAVGCDHSYDYTVMASQYSKMLKPAIIEYPFDDYDCYDAMYGHTH